MNTTDKPNQPADQARRPDPRTDGLLDRVFAWLDISLVRQAAGELARECHAAVWSIQLGIQQTIMSASKDPITADTRHTASCRP